MSIFRSSWSGPWMQCPDAFSVDTPLLHYVSGEISGAVLVPRQSAARRMFEQEIVATQTNSVISVSYNTLCRHKARTWPVKWVHVLRSGIYRWRAEWFVLKWKDMTRQTPNLQPKILGKFPETRVALGKGWKSIGTWTFSPYPESHLKIG